MKIKNGFVDIPDGKIATIVTSLEMFSRPVSEFSPEHPEWSLEHVRRPHVEWYRKLYKRVGIEWLWFSRIVMDDNQLAAEIQDPMVDVYCLRENGYEQGLLELDYRSEGECELAFLGVSSQVMGKGAGRWLMENAMRIAWSKPINRLWIHTCTLDHPRALPFYMRCGFTPYKRQLEIADDPRITGIAPKNTAKHYPLLENN